MVSRRPAPGQPGKFILEHYSFFFDSDAAGLDQDAATILCAIEIFVRLLRGRGELVKVLYISSDNCSCQNKCGTLLLGAGLLGERLGIHICWKYCCPGHGKCEADGQGAHDKGELDRALQRATPLWGGETAKDTVEHMTNFLMRARPRYLAEILAPDEKRLQLIEVTLADHVGVRRILRAENEVGLRIGGRLNERLVRHGYAVDELG